MNPRDASGRNKKREHLNAYTVSAQHIVLAQVAISALEGMNRPEATRAIRILKLGQVKELKRLDSSAAKLGAPRRVGGEAA
jgi:hypothetical protein